MSYITKFLYTSGNEGEGLKEALTDVLGLVLALGDSDTDTLGDVDAEGLSDGLVLLDGLTEGLRDALTLGDNEGLALVVAEGLSEALKLGLGEGLNEAVAEGLADGLKLALGLTEGDLETLTEGEVEADGLKLTDTLGEAEALGDKLTLALADTLGERDTETDGDNEGLKLGDNEGLRETDTEGDNETDTEAETEGLGEPALGIRAQTAVVEVPVFTYTFRPEASKSLNKAPLTKPSYPSGTVLPSASTIKSVAEWGVEIPESWYLNTLLVR